MDRIAKWVSVICGLALVFLAGMGVTEYKVFPYELIRQTKNGIEAMLQLEDTSNLEAVAFEAPDRDPGPHYQTVSPAAGTEPILVTGGFHQYQSQCPEFGCVAWIVDRTGTVLHKWQVDPSILTEGVTGFEPSLAPENLRVVGTRLGADGQLLVTLHARNSFPYTVGIFALDKDSNLLWKRIDGAHHWFDLDSQGNIYVAYAQAADTLAFYPGTAIRQNCRLDRYHGDGLAIYSPEGELMASFDIAKVLVDSGFPGSLYAVRDGCDPHHLNSVEYLDAKKAAAIPGARAGSLLIGMREHNMIAVFDPATALITHAYIDRSAAQHSPQLMPDGTIAIFDNQGGDIEAQGSRILGIESATGQTRTLFPRGAEHEELIAPFWSGDGGHLDVSADGTRLMVSSKNQSLTFEIDAKTGAVLWTMDKIMDISRYNQIAGRKNAANVVGFNAYSAYYLQPADLRFLK